MGPQAIRQPEDPRARAGGSEDSGEVPPRLIPMGDVVALGSGPWSGAPGPGKGRFKGCLAEW